MIARFAGGMLGLLAFAIATVTGLFAGNPPMVILSRALWATLVFCAIGLAVGAAAQAVVNEYVSRKEAELFPAKEEDEADAEDVNASAAVPQVAGTE